MFRAVASALKRGTLCACLPHWALPTVPRASARQARKELPHPGGQHFPAGRPSLLTIAPFPGMEGDLIVGLKSSAIGTLVERTTRFHPAAAPAPHAGHARIYKPRIKNGPPLDRHGAEAVRERSLATIDTPSLLKLRQIPDRGTRS